MLAPLEAFAKEHSPLQNGEVDFPMQKKEQWKYTPLESLLNIEQYSTYTTEQLTVTGGTIADLQKEHSPKSITACADALFQETYTQITPTKKDLTINYPTHNNATLATSTIHITAPENTNTTIAIEHNCTSQTLALRNIIICLEKNATVSVQEQQLASNKYHLLRELTVFQKELSTFSHTVHSTQAKGITRNNTTTILLETGTTTALYGLTETTHKGHIDQDTAIEHNVAGSVANEQYNSIAHDQSTAVFHGKIHIHPGAGNTKSNQHGRNILLSEEARSYARPELQIYADDVECSHGTTVGSLDEEQLFYLQTRGLSKKAATTLLLESIRNEILETKNK